MVIDAKGDFYAPSPPPQSGGEQELRQWNVREYGRISTAIRTGRSWFISLDVMRKLPAKPFAGMICYFAAGVLGTGEGCHEYRSDNAWHKL
jgi:hypothetical protein